MVNIKLLLQSLDFLCPMLSFVLKNKLKFLFINVDSSKSSILCKSLFNIIKSLTINLSYDWGFGFLSNHKKMNIHLTSKFKYHFPWHPNIIVFLRMFEKEYTIMSEVNRFQILTIWLINFNISKFVDYPVPATESPEYVYFFFKFLLNFVINEFKFNSFYNNYVSKKEFIN